MNQHRRRSFQFVASRTHLRVRNPRRYNDNCQRHFQGSGRDRFGVPRPVLRSGPRLTRLWPASPSSSVPEVEIDCHKWELGRERGFPLMTTGPGNLVPALSSAPCRRNDTRRALG